MLFKLSLSNIRKSLRDYAIYFFTLIIGVSVFYVFNTVSATVAMTVIDSDRREIARILRENAEETWAARIAAIICEHREQKPLQTTADLVRCVDAAIPKRVRMQEEGHSARRTFQALRIAVNDELEPLSQALCDMARMLRPGGRLAVLTFHSLEDRIVKQTFRRLANPCICPPRIPVCVCGRIPQVRLLGGGQKPSKEEIAANPRAHSAMLRGVERLDAPEWRI